MNDGVAIAALYVGAMRVKVFHGFKETGERSGLAFVIFAGDGLFSSSNRVFG